MRCIVQTDTRRLMHVDHMCATLIPSALPHFSEATSNVSQLSEGEADEETSREAECRGNLLQGTRRALEQQRMAGLGRCMPRHVCMGPLLAWGGLQLSWGFSQYLNWDDVKVWWATGNHRNEAEETKGFHPTPCWRGDYHAIKPLSTKHLSHSTPVEENIETISAVWLEKIWCQGLLLCIFQVLYFLSVHNSSQRASKGIMCCQKYVVLPIVWGHHHRD